MPSASIEGPADESADGALPDLGHPVTVFVDTSFFLAQNFAFGGALFKALLAGVAAGDVRFVTSEITRREVHAQLLSGIDAAQAAIGRFKKEAKILKGLPAHPLAVIFKEPYWNETKASLAGEWEGFLKTAKAEILPIDGTAAAAVFEDYFTRKAPFGNADKKSEFPDAFVVKSLRAFGASRGCKVVVVSHDMDFRAACEGDSVLVWSPDLNKVLEHSARFRPLNPEAIHAMLAKHRKAIDAAIVTSFNDRGFYWNSDEDYDSEVEETYDEEVKSLDMAVIDVVDEWAEVSGNAKIHFRASVQYADPDSVYRDDETKELIWLGRMHATLSATATVPITFTVNVEKLKKGELDLDVFEVNNRGDVWFSEDEVEEVRRPNYSE